MNFTINSQQLASALRLLNRIVPTRPSIQILGYALLDARGDTLRLSATDLEVTLSMTRPAVVLLPGRVVLNVSNLMNLIEQFPDAPVSVVSDAKGVHVTCGKFTSKLQTLSPDDFPTLHDREGDRVTLLGNQLVTMLDKVRYAVAERGQKFILESALLRMTGTTIGMVATDTTRLSVATSSRESGPDVMVVLLRKTLSVLPLLGLGEIEMSVGRNHLFFEAGNMLLTSRTVEEKFPAYERIIPRDNDKVMTINRAALAAALRRVGIAATNYMTYFRFSENTLALRALSADVGESDEQVDAQYTGDATDIAVNWRFVLDFLEAASGETVTIAFKDANTSLLFSDGLSFINVISVMR